MKNFIMISEKLKIIELYFKTIKNYGLINSLKIFFFEVLGLLIMQDLKSLNYNDDETSTYSDTKRSKKYDVPYIPTPYYLLYLIKKKLINYNVRTFNLIDIGCGYCRPAKYFQKKFNLIFSGIEINKSIAKEISQKKNRNFKIFNFSVRNLVKVNFFFKKNLRINIINIILISDTIEVQQINKILKNLNKNYKIFIILINVKYKDFKNKDFKINEKIFFKKKSRNIIILKNH